MKSSLTGLDTGFSRLKARLDPLRLVAGSNAALRHRFAGQPFLGSLLLQSGHSQQERGQPLNNARFLQRCREQEQCNTVNR